MNEKQIEFDTELEAEFQTKFAAAANAKPLERFEWAENMHRLFNFLALHRLSVRFLNSVPITDEDTDDE